MSHSSSSRCTTSRLLMALIPLLILIGSLTTIYLLSQRLFHSLDDGTLSSSSLRFPRSLDDVRTWSHVLTRVRQQQHIIHISTNSTHELDPSIPSTTSPTSMSLLSLLLISPHDRDILLLFMLAYIVKQAFAIPGSSLLNVLAGALYSYWGWPLVSCLTAIGASCCYALSYFFGGATLARYMFGQSRIDHMSRLVHEQNQRHSLFWFCLSLRLFPCSPNFFLNFASPIIGVPFMTFFFSVLIGLAPYCFICVRSGLFLSQLSSMDSVMDISSILSMLTVSCAALIPVMISYYHHRDILKQATNTTTTSLNNKHTNNTHTTQEHQPVTSKPKPHHRKSASKHKRPISISS